MVSATEKARERPGWLSRLPITSKLLLISLVYVAIIVGLQVLGNLALGFQSSVRAFVGGEGLWSKAQKDAVHRLVTYTLLHREEDFERYRAAMAVNLGDRRARLALSRPDPDLAEADAGFIEGRNHPDDVRGTAFHLEPRRLSSATLSAAPARILIVEDEAIVARDLERSLRRLGYEVLGIEVRADEAIARVEQGRPQLILMDIRLRGPLDGIDGAREIWRRFAVPTVYLTAYADDETVARAKGTGTFGYLVKPFDPRELRATIEIALARGAEGRAAEARERRFFEMFSLLGDGVALLDAGGRIVRLNQAAEELLGRPAGEPVAPGTAGRALFEGEGEAAVLRRPGGDALAVRLCRLPLASSDGAAELVVFREAHAALPPGLRLLRREVNALLQQLIAGVVQGVGNPLFVIASHLDLLDFEVDTAPADGDVRELLRRQVERIRRLLAYLTEYAGAEPLAHAPTVLVPLVREAVRACGAAAEGRGVHFELDDRAGETRVNADPPALRTAFDHLLANAVDFSPSPGAVRVTIEREEGERPIVHVRFDDTGPGIAPEDLARVFAPFFSRRKGGTGLGLAVVRRVVEEHGGRVNAENRSTGGSRFTVSLPASRFVAPVPGSP